MKKWTEAKALRATDQRLLKIQSLLVEIGGLWSDENEYLVGRADELVREIEEFRKEVPLQVESMRDEREFREAEAAIP